MLGILLTNTPLRVLEISRGGCLLESSQQIEAGATGLLQLELGGRSFAGEVRVTRCHRIEGAGSSYRLGAEFIRTARADSSSLRRAVYSMLEGSTHRGRRSTDETGTDDLEAEA